jgi:predicted nucleic acid-binding protein
MKNKKIYLDTNIIIDMIDRARDNYPLAQRLIKKLSYEDYEVYFSEDMITTIYYILRGNELVLRFFNSVIDEWHIVPFGKDVIKEAIEFSLKHNSDLEDTLQCFCAKENGCSFLTNDKKFIDCGVKIVTYEEFLGD